MGKEYPTISAVIATYNSALTIGYCLDSLFKQVLESIKKQTYPKNKMEHIVVDGGSRKKTIALAKQYGCITIVRKDLKNQSETRRSFAVKKAKNEIILWLESDNILPDKDSLKKLVEPFIDDPKIISTFTLHYGYNKKMSLLDKYCGLFGFSDPVAYYLGKADRETWLADNYVKGKIVRRKKNYDVVEFDKKNLPTVGDNGFLTRRKVLLKANISPKTYVHIDIYVDLLKLGYKRFGVVKATSIEHSIGNSILGLVRRRVLYARRYSLSKYLDYRRYAVFDFNSPKDIMNLTKYIFYTVTFVQPLILSIRGFLKIRDTAWFLHPFMCWLFLIYYLRFTSVSLIGLKLKR